MNDERQPIPAFLLKDSAKWVPTPREIVESPNIPETHIVSTCQWHAKDSAFMVADKDAGVMAKLHAKFFNYLRDHCK